MDSRFLDVNQHGVLRVPPLLWVALALLIRYWVFVIVLAVSMRRSHEAGVLLDHGLSLPLLALELPAFAVAWAAGRRLPESGWLTRFIWRHGRVFMAATVVANLAWTSFHLMTNDFWAPWPELVLVSCSLLDVAILLSMFTNEFFKQLFNEFPSKPAEGDTP